MPHPAFKGVPDVMAGVGQDQAIQVVIPSQEPLGQAVPAEGAPDARHMRLGDALDLVATQDANWQQAGGIEHFFGYIGTEVADHLAPGPFFPLPGIAVPLRHYALELLQDLHKTPWSIPPDDQTVPGLRRGNYIFNGGLCQAQLVAV